MVNRVKSSGQIQQDKYYINKTNMTIIVFINSLN